MRLVVAFVALFAAMSVAVSFAGLILRERQIRNLFDRELLTRAADISDTVRKLSVLDDASVGILVTDLTRQIYYRDFYVQAWNDQEHIVARSENLRQTVLPLPRENLKGTDDPAVQSHRVTQDLKFAGEIGTLRGVRLRFAAAGGHTYQIIILTDPVVITEAVSGLRWLFLAGNIAGLIAAAGAAWLVTGAMARRLDLIRTQVERVGPEDLDQRIRTHEQDEISELAGHLNAMLDRLKAGFETQERFIHDVSHELKTPIATVQAEAQAILLGDPTQKELLQFAHATNDEMRRLGRLTESLLLLTRGGETHAVRRFQPVELSEVTTSALRHLSTLATDHQVRLHLDYDASHESPRVQCDADLLESMVGNLVRNAIRFSPRNSEVRIDLDHVGESAMVIVEDQGPGIPADVLPHIFDRFFRSSQLKVRRGAGVGLAIASTIAKLHGGTIHAENRPGQGARFTVQLPISVAPTVKTPVSALNFPI